MHLCWLNISNVKGLRDASPWWIYLICLIVGHIWPAILVTLQNLQDFPMCRFTMVENTLVDFCFMDDLGLHAQTIQTLLHPRGSARRPVHPLCWKRLAANQLLAWCQVAPARPTWPWWSVWGVHVFPKPVAFHWALHCRSHCVLGSNACNVSPAINILSIDCITWY